MARIRTIKPEFFTDEDVGALPPTVRLFFIALWCHADKAGRMKIKERELAAKCCPYDRLSAKKALSMLEERRFITTWEHSGIRYLQIRTWDLHQKPHHTERDTSIPPPPDNGCLTVKERTEGKGRERKGKEGKKTPPKPVSDGPISDDIDYPEGMDTVAVRKAVDDWLAYKRKRGETYKDPPRQMGLLLGEDTFHGDPELFVRAVNHSIARNYAGCFPPKGNDRKPERVDLDSLNLED